MPRHLVLYLFLSIFLTTFPQAKAQQPAFYVNGATGVNTPAAGIPAAGPVGWSPGVAPAPQGWRTIQYAITQVQAWMAANSPTVPTAKIYIQGGQSYSAATNGESFPIVVAPSILFEGTFIGQGFTAFPNMAPPAGVAAFSMPGNQTFLDRAVVGGVRYSNSLCRYIRFTGGSLGISMGANNGSRHNPRIEDCDFVEQTVAGIQVDTTSGLNDPKIYRNTFRGCARGVDMVARGVDPVLFADVEECSFESTASVVGGTGIYLLDQSTATAGSTSRVDGLFRSNNFDQVQAGIYIESTTGAKIRNPQIFRSRFANLVGNSIEVKLAGCQGQDLTVTDSVMMRGTSGIKIWGTSGGGSSRWTLDNNTFYQCLNNGLEVSVAGSGSAALSSQRQTVRECNLHGYLIQPSSPLAFSMVSERDRLLDNVRGVWLQGSATGSMTMRSSMVCRSRIFSAIRCNAPGLVSQFDGLTLADNNIGLDALASGSGSSCTHSVFDGNTTDAQGASLPPFTYCCFGGSTFPGVGNLNLVNAQLDRPFYKLRLSSPCLDAGSYQAVSGATDYEGDSRTLCWLTGGPGLRDIGADEWCGPGSTRPYGNVGFEKYNVFPRISSSTVVLRSPSIQPLEVALRDAVQPVFGTPGAGAVLFFGFEDINRSLPFDLAPLGWPGSYVQLDPATSMGFFGIAQTGPQAGSTVASIPIAPGLAGVSVTMQWFVLMPPPSDVVASDGLRVTVGNYPGSGLPVPTNMVPIQAGSYTRGSVNGLSNETPLHQVTITRPFWIGKREVTQAEYQAIRGTNPSAFQGPSYPDSAQRPVETVSWADAMQFCALLTQQQAAACALPPGYVYRLPTEAEWEYACRAGTTTEWNVGADLTCAQANFAGCNPTNQTVVVGSYGGNNWGLQDMHGNVWEWCLDADPNVAGPASINYQSNAVSDPYTRVGTAWIVRGGTRTASADACRSAIRFTSTAATSEIGFRIVLAPNLDPDAPPPGLDLVQIAPGSFTMGSSAVGTSGASAVPAFRATITRAFWIGRYEVTQAQYQAAMGINPSTFQGLNRPVESVSRAQALNYCAALNSTYASQLPAGYSFRLPTEAEWEYCCRAGTTTEWSTGTAQPTCAQGNVGTGFGTYCFGHTRDVGTFAPNAWGLHDMHGNVAEWVLDKHVLGSAYPSTWVNNPYVASGSFTLYRGGGYLDSGFALGSAVRGVGALFPSAKNGFRIVLAPTLPIQP